MRFKDRIIQIGCLALIAGIACFGLTGCLKTNEAISVGVVAGTVGLARTPSHEIEQIYYLGVFDPREQVPPAVYRVRVHGQASSMSRMRFASGWVPASLIDSLGTGIGFDKESGRISITRTDKGDELSALTTGRRMMLFGPEGFREAPKDHRLVIVMGSSPEDYFKNIDQALGVVSKTMVEQKSAALSDELIRALTEVKSQSDRLADLELDIEKEMHNPEGT